MNTVNGFDVSKITEDPGTFHARPFAEVSGPTVWVPELSPAKTLVLGSSQSSDTIDLAHLDQAGIALTSRRSGGGAVLVSNSDVVWFDVVISDTHRRWDTDVSRSFEWLGSACRRGLANLGLDLEMHTGRLASTRWSRQICFAGLGPGELTLDGKKVVGMSQRRTRDRARFQVAILRRWDGAEHAKLLNLSAADQAKAAAELGDLATGVTAPPTAVLDAILGELG